MGEPLVHMLLDTLTELHANTLCDTLCEVEDEGLIDTKHNTLLEVKADRLGVRLGDVHWSLALVDTLAGTVEEVDTKTVGKTLSDVEIEAMGQNLADTQAVVGRQQTCNTLGDVKTEAPLDTLANTLANVDARKLGDHFAMWNPRHWSTILPRR